jgi:DNA-binding winged helix-turn-helix (wHTH) protein
MSVRYRFAEYAFETARGLEGPLGRIPLRARDAHLLSMMLEGDGRVVTKDAIAGTVWPDRDVSDDSITQSVRRLRLAMPSPAGRRIVQTVYGSGVRIGVPVERLVTGAGPPMRAARRTEAEACLISAREASARRSVVGIATAIEASLHAIELDPRFAQAWSALAEFRLIQAARGIAPQRAAGKAAIAAADEALAIDPACAPALAARGFVRATIEGDPARGITDLDRSIAIDPSYWTARGLHGWALIAAGRVREAVAEVIAAAELNPWSPWYSGMPAHYLFLAGKLDDALARGRDAARRFPESDYAHHALSQIASTLELHDEAIDSGRHAKALAPDTPIVHTSLACALARAGRADEALAEIRAIEALPGPLPAVWLAPAWLALGNRERAVEMLEIAREQGAPQYVYTFYDPRFDELRDTGRITTASSTVAH